MLRRNFKSSKQRLRTCKIYVCRMAINHGLYATLNDAIVKEMPQPAKRAVDQLRNVCLMANLIGVYSLFSDRQPDDVGFNLFQKQVQQPGFQALIIDKAENWKSGEPLRTINREAAIEKISEFLSGYERGVTHCTAIKPMRNKLIAHLSLEEFPRPIIENITDGTKISIALTEAILFLFDGHDLQITTLADSASLGMTALLRTSVQ